VTTEKWKHAVKHSGGSLRGFLALFFERPGFALKLFRARLYYFRNRRLKEPFQTPDGYRIETFTELLSYWSLRVEKECFRGSWVESLKREKSPFVVDVGANAGMFTHLLWSIKPEAEIFAFEPLPRLNQKIRAWADRTRAKLTLFQRAVSDRCGTATFCVDTENDTLASLQLEGDQRNGFQVETVTLDSAVPDRPIFLIKIDVEGFEPAVLAGAKKTIQNARFLVIEAHDKEALAKLAEKLGSEWQSEQVGSSDYFFRRTNDIKT
jgi:FkbM family methyltransferase